jgi:hypothetical protein
LRSGGQESESERGERAEEPVLHIGHEYRAGAGGVNMGIGTVGLGQRRRGLGTRAAAFGRSVGLRPGLFLLLGAG